MIPDSFDNTRNKMQLFPSGSCSKSINLINSILAFSFAKASPSNIRIGIQICVCIKNCKRYIINMVLVFTIKITNQLLALHISKLYNLILNWWLKPEQGKLL